MMVDYCKQDVLSLEKIYHYLLKRLRDMIKRIWAWITGGELVWLGQRQDCNFVNRIHRSVGLEQNSETVAN